jgi:hypothetical protein
VIKQSWRDILEVAAVISVVAGLSLVAYEIRQANGIARTQAVMDLSAQYNEVNRTRFSDPTFAALFGRLSDPGRLEVTATESSMIWGLGYHLHNTLWSAQTAHDNGLLSRDGLNIYRDDLSLFLNLPGLAPTLVQIFNEQVDKQDAYVFEPLAELVDELRAESEENE